MSEKVKAKLPDLDRYLDERHMKRHFVDYFEGASMMGIPYYSFVRLAREAEAHYPLRKTAVIDINKVEAYLEEHPEVAERIGRVREV